MKLVFALCAGYALMGLSAGFESVELTTTANQSKFDRCMAAYEGTIHASDCHLYK